MPTGVKYLHHAAKDYDIGIYFEANGHGTVLFSPRAEKMLQERIEGKLLDVPFATHRKRRDSHVAFKTDEHGDVLVENIAQTADGGVCESEHPDFPVRY